MVEVVATLVILLTSPGLLDPEGEGTRILRSVGRGMLYMEMKALESFETSRPGLFDPEDKGSRINRIVGARTA